MKANCFECKEVVEGVDIQVLPRGHEQPIPYVFHQKCFENMLGERLMMEINP